MRRALVVLAVLVVVAGAFTAGALIFRGGGGDDNVAESQVRCVDLAGPTVGDDDCAEVFDDEKRVLCAGEEYDGVKITIIYETQYAAGDTEEDGRRTFTEDC